MNGLFYLCHLVYLKNQLNRKRRRFYKLMNPGVERFNINLSDAKCYSPKIVSRYVDYDGETCATATVHKPTHPLYSLIEARAGYEAAKRDMKSMTAHMRKVRTELGARFEWDDTGNIRAMMMEGKRYKAEDFAMLHEAYLSDEILLA